MSAQPHKDIKLEKQFTRLLFPFTIENEAAGTGSETISFKSRFFSLDDEILKHKIGGKEKGKAVWKVKREKKDEQILPHVHEFFFPENRKDGSRYVLAYRLDKDARPDLFSHRFAIESKKISCTIAFKSVDLFLFRSGIGILALDLEVKGVPEKGSNGEWRSASVDDIRKINAELVRWHYGTYSFRKKVSGEDLPPDDHKNDKITMGALLEQFLAPFGKRKKDWEALTMNLLGFTYLFLSKKGEDGELEPLAYEEVADPFFGLRCFLDEKHRPAKQSLRLEDNPNIVQNYDNVFFGLSGSGWAIVVLDNGAEFLKNQFQTKVRDNYFLLFLLGLHRLLAVQRLEQRLAGIDMFREDKESARAFIVKVREYRDWVFDFTLHCSFNQVSNNDNYTRLHDLWSQVLGADRGELELRAIVEELDDYLERAERKKQEEARDKHDYLEREERKKQEEARDKQSALIYLLNFFAIPLVIGATFLELYENTKTDHLYALYALAVIASSYVITLIVWACIRYRRTRRGKQKS